ncbi:hypothetical protein CEXT_587291 [Caerostris extrusa]|uniref:Uncharacterized protein n=1 Tax=Caerostris extrusa TaxID=172846 RepID=A0AAV4RPV6_CAEEX|nr:hypothetical protein CEXT_587291 [Caerostris extrusa]
MPEPPSETIRARQDGSFENIFPLIGCLNAPPYEKKGRLLTLEEDMRWGGVLCKLNKAFYRIDGFRKPSVEKSED